MARGAGGLALFEEVEELVDLGSVGRGSARQRKTGIASSVQPRSLASSTVVLWMLAARRRPFGAMHFDTLVMAIGGAAGVGDNDDLARSRLHLDRGGIDIVGLADFRIGQNAAKRMNR